MNNTDNASAIITICSHLCVGDGVKPLEPSEWSKLAATLHNQSLQPKDLFTFSDNDFTNILGYDAISTERLKRLLDRSGSITFEIEKYSNMGISIVTRSDDSYPKKLRKTLKNHCPPLFYYAGELAVTDKSFVGFVGSRDVDFDDADFTQKTVDKVIRRGFGVVSGGAKGIDSISREKALEEGGFVVEYISDSLTKRIKEKNVIDAIRAGRLVILSVAKPDAGFNTGIAMMRNRYIYAHSVGTVVVKSDLKKGGTWNGAVDNLRNNWCCTFCREKDSYTGNTELIKKGAIAIDEKWDADVLSHKPPENANYQQLSFSELLKVSEPESTNGYKPKD